MRINVWKKHPSMEQFLCAAQPIVRSIGAELAAIGIRTIARPSKDTSITVNNRLP